MCWLLEVESLLERAGELAAFLSVPLSYLGCCCSCCLLCCTSLSHASLPVSVSSESLCLLTSMCTLAATSVHCINSHWKTSLSFEALQASACLTSYTSKEPVNLPIADNLTKTPMFHSPKDCERRLLLRGSAVLCTLPSLPYLNLAFGLLVVTCKMKTMSWVSLRWN